LSGKLSNGSAGDVLLDYTLARIRAGGRAGSVVEGPATAKSKDLDYGPFRAGSRNFFRPPGFGLDRTGSWIQSAGIMKSQERLTQPYVRDGSSLRPATWEEALDRAAALLRETLARSSPDAFGLFCCSKATNEVNYLAGKFVRSVIGCNHIDSCNRT
jgi:hypothetical protein